MKSKEAALTRCQLPSCEKSTGAASSQNSSMRVSLAQSVAPSVSVKSCWMPRPSTTNQPLVDQEVKAVSEHTNIKNCPTGDLKVSQPQAASLENASRSSDAQDLIALRNMKIDQDKEDAAAGLVELFNSSADLSHFEDPNLPYSCGSLNHGETGTTGSPMSNDRAPHINEYSNTSCSKTAGSATDSSLRSWEFRIDEEHPFGLSMGESVVSLQTRESMESYSKIAGTKRKRNDERSDLAELMNRSLDLSCVGSVGSATLDLSCVGSVGSATLALPL